MDRANPITCHQNEMRNCVKVAIGRWVLSQSLQVDICSPTAALGGKVRRDEEREGGRWRKRGREREKGEGRVTGEIRRTIRTFSFYTCPSVKEKSGADTSPLTNGRHIS